MSEATPEVSDLGKSVSTKKVTTANDSNFES